MPGCTTGSISCLGFLRRCFTMPQKHGCPIQDSRFKIQDFCFLLLLLLLASACRDTQESARGARTAREPLADLPAESALAEVERWLLETAPLQIQFIVTSEGAVESNLRGAVALLEAEGLSITADGQFIGAEQMLRLMGDGQRLTLSSPAGSSEVAQPAGLREAVVIGFTRMGILHNLARLVAGQPPDHMEGGVRDWAQATNVTWGPREMVDGVEALTLDFDIVVSGSPAGSARLYLDAITEQPIRRTQTVEFPEGEVRVVEGYEVF
jgi:hypothetical protein